MLVTHFPQAAKRPETLRAISADETRLSVVLDQETVGLLQRAKERLSHAQPNAGWAEIIKYVLKEFIKRAEGLRSKATRVVTHLTRASATQGAAAPITQGAAAEATPRAATAAIPRAAARDTPAATEASLGANNRTTFDCDDPTPSEESRRSEVSRTGGSLSMGLRRAVLRRSDYTCEHVEVGTGWVCGSRYQVEVDHIVPRALGGTDDLENLRCLCRVHNMAMAERELGEELMSRYWPRR